MGSKLEAGAFILTPRLWYTLSHLGPDPTSPVLLQAAPPGSNSRSPSGAVLLLDFPAPGSSGHSEQPLPGK